VVIGDPSVNWNAFSTQVSLTARRDREEKYVSESRMRASFTYFNTLSNPHGK
jgi:hypothetical protein